MAQLQTYHQDQAVSAVPSPALEQGRVYRSSDFDSRVLEQHRVAGRLVDLGFGLVAHPKKSRFGVVMPNELEMLRAFFGSTPFVVTGPVVWNALGLGSTGVFARSLVYNSLQSGILRLGKRTFELVRVAHVPENPTPEWFAVDLLENAGSVGASAVELAVVLRKKLERGLFDGSMLRQFSRHASTRTQKLVESVVSGAIASA